MTVILTARAIGAAAARARELAAVGLDVRGEPLDVAEDASVEALAQRLFREPGRLDVLVNNAATFSSYGETPSRADFGQARAAMEPTLFGAWRTTQAFLPLLRASGHGRVVSVSSGAGSHGDPVFGLESTNSMGPAYAVAKAALNALTAAFARELRPDGILVNAVCPGFTAKFPDGVALGARPVAEGAASVAWAPLLPDGGPTGGFFRDGRPLAW